MAGAPSEDEGARSASAAEGATAAAEGACSASAAEGTTAEEASSSGPLTVEASAIVDSNPLSVAATASETGAA
jgi:hypothetical protein